VVARTIAARKFALRRVDRDDPQAGEKPVYAQLTREELLESIEREKRLLSEAPAGYQKALPDADKAAG
jgi:hypothetical protein